MEDLTRLVTDASLSTTDIAGKTSAIRERLLRQSRYIKAPNFTTIHPSDLRILFEAYDQTFFHGTVARGLASQKLSFRLSRRLTSSGGKTTRRVFPQRVPAPRVEYEICVSTTLLFQAFLDVDRPVSVAGLHCGNRVEVLQRVFEHELIHLIESLVWSQSSCAAPRFQSLAQRFFGHRAHTHQLITPRERVFSQFGLKVGDRVAFRFEGRHHEGVLNRVTRRATVLIEDPRGERYSDGKCYAKYYVPLNLLEAVNRRGT